MPAEVTDYARAKTKKCIDKLGKVVDLPLTRHNLAAIVSAANSILNRAWGTPYMQEPPDRKPKITGTVTVTFGAQLPPPEPEAEPAPSDQR